MKQINRWSCAKYINIIIYRINITPTAIILRLCSLDYNWHAASSMAATQNIKHRPSASRDTAQVDYACRIPEDITRMLAYTFSRCISH